MFFSGGLAQLVEQRTRRSVKYQDFSPCEILAVAEIEVFSELKSACTPKHTKDKKALSIFATRLNRTTSM
jgi:hypothetical protein